jgi:hypothetical protein
VKAALGTRDPLCRLPPVSEHFREWEELGDDLGKLLVCGAAVLRPVIASRVGQGADVSTLPSDQAERVFLLLSFFAHAYVW